MIKIPFDRDTFAEQAKQRISGINVTLNYDNIESGLIKSGVEIQKVIGENKSNQRSHHVEQRHEPPDEPLWNHIDKVVVNHRSDKHAEELENNDQQTEYADSDDVIITIRHLQQRHDVAEEPDQDQRHDNEWRSPEEIGTPPPPFRSGAVAFEAHHRIDK